MTEQQDLIELARTQRGAVSRAQAISHGLTDQAISRRLIEPRWTSPTPGVYLLEGAPPGRFRDLWVAHLAIGPTSVVSVDAAGQIHGLPGTNRSVISLTDVHGAHQRLGHSLPNLELHHTRLMDRLEVTRIDGLPVTSVRQTIVDLSASMGLAALATVVDHAKTQRLASYEAMAEQLTTFRGTRRKGLRKLAIVLSERLDGAPVGDTELEKQLLRIIRRAGLADPLAQVPLPSQAAMPGLCDFGYTEAKLLLEADGRPWHTRIADIRRDRQRDLEAAAAGWLTVRMMHEDMTNDPVGTGRTIAMIHKERVALLRHAA